MKTNQDTGALTALIRLLEQQREDFLYKDEFAERFVNEDAAAMLQEKMDLYPYFQQLITVRHKLFRDEIFHFLENDPQITQIVSIGSGYCTLVHQILKKFNHLKGFEVDKSSVIARKKSKVGEQYASNFVPCDVITELEHLVPGLKAHGFDNEKRSIIFFEGLLYYMPDADSIKLFIHKIANMMSSNSILIFDMQVGAGSFKEEEKDFLDYFEHLSTWAAMIEEQDLWVLKFGNIAFMDKWNRLTAFRGRAKSSIFVIGKQPETKSTY